jgi:hypothetical protein
VSEQKNACPTGATVEQAEGSGLLCNAEPRLTGNFSTRWAAGQGFWVSGVLGTDRESALTAAELQALFGLSEPRVVTRQIQRERQAGAPICAVSNGDSRGYYLTDDPDELGRYIRSLDHRVREIRGTQEGLRRTLLLLSGQTAIEGYER